MARSAAGVVRPTGIPLLLWFFPSLSNHPRRGLWRGIPSLAKEGSLIAVFRDRT